MNVFKSVILILVFATTGYCYSSCSIKNEFPKDLLWRDMEDTCIKAMKDQIQMEINVSTAYLAMGAYFSRDTVNRPGFANMFFNSAKEERDHAMKLISYLLMRGQLTGETKADEKINTEVTDLIKIGTVNATEWDSGVSASEAALKLEVEVTKSIKNLIITCESAKTNDYHLVDYLTSEFLEQQYYKQREIAGRIATLSKMNEGVLGEFLYDKTLLE